MTIQGLYCYLDMGKNTVTYHKCSHVPNLLKIKNHLDIMCPVRYLKVSVNKPPWLSHHITESINDRNKLFREANATQDNDILSRAQIDW